MHLIMFFIKCIYKFKLMKKLKYLLLIFLLATNIYSQNKISVIYSVDFIGEVFKKRNNSISQNLVSGTKGTETKIKSLEFKLTVDKNKSIFNVIPQMEKDNESLGEKMGKIVAGYDDIFYRDNDSKILINNFLLDGKKINLLDKFEKYKWEFSKEERLIQGYKCYLAKTKLLHLEINAWYCPQLPYSTGPRDFGQLPGLILELQKGDLIFQAKKITFDDNIKLDYDLKTFKTITVDENEKMLKNIRDKYLNQQD